MLVQILLPIGAALLAGSAATPLSRVSDVQPAIPVPIPDSPVVDMDRIADISLPDTMRRSVELINQLYQEPTCKQYAVAALLGECASITNVGANTPSNVREQLDIERSLFAVRITVCDLERDHMHINETCQAFLPGSHSKPSRSKKRSYFSWSADDTSSPPTQRDPQYEQASAKDRESCLNSLGNDKNGIGWTSYSHNYQQAGAACHALRGDIERDDAIGTLRTFGDILGSYEQVLKTEKEELRRTSKDWSELQVLVRQNYVQQSDANSDLAARFRKELAAWFTDVGASLQSAKDTADDLNNDIDRADASVKRLKDAADLSLDTLLEHTNGAVKESKDNIIVTSGEVIKFFQQDMSAKLEQFMGKASQELDARHREQVARHDALDSRLETTSAHVESFKAEVISAAQIAAKEAAKEHASQFWAGFNSEVFRVLRAAAIYLAYFALWVSILFTMLWKAVGLSYLAALLIAFWAAVLISVPTAGLLNLAAVHLFVSAHTHYILLGLAATAGICIFVVIICTYIFGKRNASPPLLADSCRGGKLPAT